jgi:hypothetical protein
MTLGIRAFSCDNTSTLIWQSAGSRPSRYVAAPAQRSPKVETNDCKKRSRRWSDSHWPHRRKSERPATRVAKRGDDQKRRNGIRFSAQCIENTYLIQ